VNSAGSTGSDVREIEQVMRDKAVDVEKEL
jgi:hypothetical protein